MPVLADTFSPEVAAAALDAGAAAINDISAAADAALLELVAERGLRLRPDAHRGAAAGRPPGAATTTTSSRT